DNVRLVLLPVVVTNKKGRVVEGLGLQDFALSEDRVPQQIEHLFTEEDVPISLAFLLDLSGSMAQEEKLEEAKHAIQVFVHSLQSDDRFGLIGFADRQVTWITEFTGDIDNFDRRLGVQEGYGQTALFDAIAATPGLVDGSVEGRKAIVLITDGNDNSSKLDKFSAVALARRVPVPIYTIGFSSISSGVLPRGYVPKSLQAISRFSEETGGNLFVVHDPSDLKEAVLRIQSELRTQYVVSYRPTRQLWDGSFRKIKLSAGKQRIVHTRTGYYAQP
ncbi:MAG: VWA domain-containing protein, partial [Acidobacteriota bacterium]|nr:VWA domain-containing protein [Acidobacteriota bacterium]